MRNGTVSRQAAQDDLSLLVRIPAPSAGGWLASARDNHPSGNVLGKLEIVHASAEGRRDGRKLVEPDGSGAKSTSEHALLPSDKVLGGKPGRFIKASSLAISSRTRRKVYSVFALGFFPAPNRQGAT